MKKRTAAFLPDINVIELVWHDLEEYIRKHKCHILEDLVFYVRRFEKKLTPEYCRRYILEEVLKAIIRKKGAWSDH